MVFVHNSLFLSAVDLIELHLIIGTFTIVTCVVIFIYMYLHAIKAYMNDIEYNFVFNVVKWNISFFNFHVCIYTHYLSLGKHKYFSWLLKMFIKGVWLFPQEDNFKKRRSERTDFNINIASNLRIVLNLNKVNVWLLCKWRVCFITIFQQLYYSSEDTYIWCQLL